MSTRSGPTYLYPKKRSRKKPSGTFPDDGPEVGATYPKRSFRWTNITDGINRERLMRRMMLDD